MSHLYKVSFSLKLDESRTLTQLGRKQGLDAASLTLCHPEIAGGQGLGGSGSGRGWGLGVDVGVVVLGV